MGPDHLSALAVDPDASISNVQDPNVFALPVGQAEDASTALLDETDKEPSMQSAEASPIPLPDGWIASPAIGKLPLELLSYIAKLSLPKFHSSRERMTALYSLRMISRMWRNAIDTTPSLWGVISSDVPLHVNTTAIQRSGNCPLHVYIEERTWESHGIQESRFTELVELAAKEIRRWSTVTLLIPTYDDCSKYLSSPAPLLQNLSVTMVCDDKPATPMDFFAGVAPKLEKLEVNMLHMDWASPFIQGLRELNLGGMSDEQISAQQLLDILASTPLLDTLCIEYATLVHHPQPLPTSHAVIQLPNLQNIRLHVIDVEAVELILSSIRAPSCTSLGIWLEGEETDDPNLPERALGHFDDFQRRTLSASKESIIRFCDEDMQWESSSASPDYLAWFDVNIPYSAAADGIRWATRVIGLGAQELVHDLELTLAHESLDDEDLAAYYSFSRCQSVTRIVIDDNHAPTDPILDLIGTWRESGDGTEPQPAFPGLKSLELASWDEWTLDDLEVLVGRRFGGSEDIRNGKVPKLRIILQPLYPDDVNVPKLDLIQLQRLRAARGVESVTREFAKNTRGTLAVVYDDDTGL
ncbi:hypothetical protein FRC04_002438 [Tulasnella sp. 424]|nr:hypothetical protein FRC04_002438 [Tulasnella sp. 424]KAG8967382.1 hypothetical protein FRC05_002092 [Tulasnella sp. 425]